MKKEKTSNPNTYRFFWSAMCVRDSAGIFLIGNSQQ